MLAFIAVFAVISIIASVFVVAASMLSSRLGRSEDHYLADEIEVDQSSLDVPAGRSSQSPL